MAWLGTDELLVVWVSALEMVVWVLQTGLCPERCQRVWVLSFTGCWCLKCGGYRNFGGATRVS